VRAISGIDHNIVGVRDLEAARATYARLGFTLTPRGRHVGWGTANYCIMFTHGYVELLGIADPAQFTNGLDKFLEQREGLLGFAFATPDAEAAARQLAAAGLEPQGPKDLGRLLELPEGDVTPRFKLVMLPPRATPGVSAFVCQHLTPELLRRPAWEKHANGAMALIGMTAVVEDPRSLLDAYETLCGAGSATMTDDTLTVRSGGSYLVFARPDDLPALHPDVELPEAPVPFLAAMTIAVADLDATRRYLEEKGLEPAFDRAGSLRLDARTACGIVLEFRQA
jgi:catechol 2,3-dioxygenase-like lactoylglutathione lyase family enzyme